MQIKEYYRILCTCSVTIEQTTSQLKLLGAGGIFCAQVISMFGKKAQLVILPSVSVQLLHFMTIQDFPADLTTFPISIQIIVEN